MAYADCCEVGKTRCEDPDCPASPQRTCPHCAGVLVDKGHGPLSVLVCRACLADVPRNRHGPAEPRRISYPGGKDGWFRVDCIRPGCDYEATEALAHRAVKRVEAHARDKGDRP